MFVNLYNKMQMKQKDLIKLFITFLNYKNIVYEVNISNLLSTVGVKWSLAALYTMTLWSLGDCITIAGFPEFYIEYHNITR